MTVIVPRGSVTGITVSHLRKNRITEEGAVAKPENFERAFSYRVNRVYRVYGGIFGYYRPISQKK